MTKHFYYTFLLCLLTNNFLKAQVIDKEILECNYKLTWMPDSNRRNVIKEDFMILKVGKKASDFYSYNTFRVDSSVQVDIKKGLSAVEMLGKRSSYGKKGMEYHIFKNFPTGKITVTEKIGTDNFKYEEPLNQQWNILSEKSKIDGYSAQKATCTFSGRQYTAWFTNEVSTATGPWKFSGLPGLILKVEDKMGNFKFEMVGLHQVKNGPAITLEKKSYIVTTKKAVLKLDEKFKKDPVAYLNANTSLKITPVGDNQVKERPYNPIEL